MSRVTKPSEPGIQLDLSSTHLVTATGENDAMDESESLESLVNTINTLSERPYDVSIHAEFLKLANSLEGVDAEVESGLEMITQCMAAGDEVWIPFLEKKMPDVISTREEAEEVFGLFNKAEQDYLCASLRPIG